MIAKRLGRPFASRAVGQALKRNPIPIVVPCHRVVRGDGTLGGFDMGPDMKMRLLSLEGIRLDDLERSMIQT
jgi:methylated-DNA-[protein]-cysteine S-methyltransferase